uniref:tRNA (guanine(26)-N(2))-dimethyltransferase n=1 Tax=Phallusia mammillata TaxID=59560 RepID=A0A6F9DUY9_9ASCI|nr:tRNA (guanine(26)-N(2))-dimethyltransferase [Phallusia mammillata]
MHLVSNLSKGTKVLFRTRKFHNQYIRSCCKMDVDNSCEKFDTVKEGKAEIVIPKDQQGVFYNHVQEFNRDLTLATISEFSKGFLEKKNIHMAEFERKDPSVIHVNQTEDGSGETSDTDNEKMTNYVYQGEKCEEGITILEALAASGLRSLRFAKELSGVKKIIANDISTPAYDVINKNIKHNKVEDLVEARNADAVLLMHQNCDKDRGFNVIDIDPFGSASVFLDAAVKSVLFGGILCVTCTDMAILAGKYPETCWMKYQCTPAVTKAHGEQALRILLGAISSAAARHSRYIEPLLSVSVDFYVRVFVRVHYGPAKTKLASCKQIQMYRCSGCSSFYCQNIIGSSKPDAFHPGIGPPVGPICEHCGHKHRVCGPFWGEPLHNLDFVKGIISLLQRFPNRFKTAERILSILTMITEELPDVPFYYVNDELSKVLRVSAPSMKIVRSAILNAGYRVSSFHSSAASIKTDAPPLVIWDIMRKFVASLPQTRKKPLPDGTPAKAILSKPITSPNIDLTERKDWEAQSKVKGMVRFPEMPPNWGPKARAKIIVDGTIKMDESLQEKSRRFQGKRKSQRNKNSSKVAKVDVVDT